VTNDRSLYADLPADGSWTQTHALAVGSNFLDRFIMTNTIAVAGVGTYSLSAFMSFAGVGGPVISNYYVLFSTDGAGTTNILGTSTVAAVNGSLIARNTHVYISDTSCCTNEYLGIDSYATRVGGVSATLTFQGGDSTYDSHLETPTLGSAATVWGNITGTLADQTDLNTELTNRYTKAEADAAFLEPTSDGSGLTNMPDSITFMIYAPTNSEPYAWGQFDWTCRLTNAQVQLVGATGIVDIVRKEWNATAFVVINSNIAANAAAVNDATFADAAYTNGQDVGIRWREISAISATNTLKCTIKARR
jgi:hypothetical protein